MCVHWASREASDAIHTLGVGTREGIAVGGAVGPSVGDSVGVVVPAKVGNSVGTGVPCARLLIALGAKNAGITMR